MAKLSKYLISGKSTTTKVVSLQQQVVSLHYSLENWCATCEIMAFETSTNGFSIADSTHISHFK